MNTWTSRKGRIVSYLLQFFLLLHIGGSFVHGQTRMTKIKDGTVANTDFEPFSGALLELESINKGLLVSRLTTAQRDAIALKDRSNGMLIYNISTDCFNYWAANTENWLSICGTPPPAVMRISNCDQVKAGGTLTQGIGLDANNYLEVPVTVNQAGTYEVAASTENGYYFMVSGTFPNAGNYTLYLPGMGTPRTGYVEGDPGDVLTIKINGVEVTNCRPNVFVRRANVDYSLICGQINVMGDYMMGVPLHEGNKIRVLVNVIVPGYWSIWTPTINGYSFAGNGTFNETGEHWVELQGTGTPVTGDPSPNMFTLADNAENSVNCDPFPVPIKPVSFVIECDAVEVGGSYMHDVPLGANNTLNVKVQVTSTGYTTLETNTVNGFKFSSGSVLLHKLGEQVIPLMGSGTPEEGIDTPFEIGATPGGTVESCNVTVPVKAQPVTFSMTCASIEVEGGYRPKLPMTEENKMTINVRPEYVGEWKIETNWVNGVQFTGSGTFTQPGEQQVVLQAHGTPISGGQFNYTLTSNSASGNTTCTYRVTFVYRTMNILGIGRGVYQPGSASASNSSRAILANSNSFGPNGTVKVQRLNIFNAGETEGATLRNAINSNNIDIIVIGYNYTPGEESRSILEDFVKNKKGVLIHSQENSSSGTADLINRISGGNVSVSGSGSVYFNPTLDVDDPILNGPFGDLRSKGTGSDVNNSYYVTNIPSSMIILGVNENDRNRVHIMRHRTLGYLYVGDSGWTAGNSSSGSSTIYPARITSTGLPQTKPYSGGNTVYNSFAYANAIAWAIQYAEEHINADYQVR